MDNHKMGSVAALTSQFNNSVSLHKNMPACGVKAKKLKSGNKLTSICSSLLSSTKKNPGNVMLCGDEKSSTLSMRDCDPRPDNEYDVPWDFSSKRIINRSTSVKEELKRFTETREDDVSGAGTHRSVGSHSSTDDSGVYEEPWDFKPGRHTDCLQINTTTASDSYCGSPNCELEYSNKKCASARCKNCQISCQNPPPFNSCISGQKSNFCKTGSPGSASSFSSRNSSKNEPVRSRLIDAHLVVNGNILSDRDACSKMLPNFTENDVETIPGDRIKVLTDNWTTPQSRTLSRITCKHKGVALDIPLIKQPSAFNYGPGKHSPSTGEFELCGSSSNFNLVPKPKDERILPDASIDGETENCYDAPWEFSSNFAISGICYVKEVSAKNAKHKTDPVVCPGTNFTNQQNHDHISELPVVPSSCCLARNQSVNLSFESESWYHGNITRLEAEERLKNAVEGSFLIRSCEGSQSVGSADQDYALSLCNTNGFMHMKIQLNDRNKWVLGYFSYPFDSVSQMISFYSRNKLPIKGAEHICLGRPIFKELMC